MAPDALLRWLATAAQRARARRRPRSCGSNPTATSVHIVTIHKAKGLEYPIVFCPFFFEGGYWQPRTDVREYHDDGDAVLDFTPADKGNPDSVGDRRQDPRRGRGRARASPLRRADARVHSAATSSRASTAMVQGRSTRRALARSRNWLVAGDGMQLVAWLANGRSPDDIAAAWRAPRGKGCTGHRDRAAAARPRRAVRQAATDPAAIVARTPPARIRAEWRIGSFSALAQGATSDGAAADHDARAVEPDATAAASSAQRGRHRAISARRRAASVCTRSSSASTSLTPDGWPTIIADALAQFPRARRRGRRATRTDGRTDAARRRRRRRLPMGGTLATVTRERRLVELGFTLPASTPGYRALCATPSRARATRCRAWRRRRLVGYLKRLRRSRLRARRPLLRTRLEIEPSRQHGGRLRQRCAGARDARSRLPPAAADLCGGARPLPRAGEYRAIDHDTHFGGVLYLFVRGVRPRLARGRRRAGRRLFRPARARQRSRASPARFACRRWRAHSMDDTSIERSLPEHTLAQAFAERVARWAHDHARATAASTDAARVAAYAVSMAVSSGHTCVPLARDRERRRRRGLARAAGGFAQSSAAVADGCRVSARRRRRAAACTSHAISTTKRGSRAPSRTASSAPLAQRVARGIRDAGGAVRPLRRDGPEAGGGAARCCATSTIVSGGPGTGKTATRREACRLPARRQCRMPGRIWPHRPARPPHGSRKPSRRSDRASRHRFAIACPPPSPPCIGCSACVAMAADSVTTRAIRCLSTWWSSTRRRCSISRSPRGSWKQCRRTRACCSSATRTSSPRWRPAQCLPNCRADRGVHARLRRGARRANWRAPAAIAAMTHNVGDALSDSVIWLTENFRFAHDSGIGRVATAVNAGDAASARSPPLRDDVAANVRWIDDAGVTPAGDTPRDDRQRLRAGSSTRCARCPIDRGAVLRCVRPLPRAVCRATRPARCRGHQRGDGETGARSGEPRRKPQVRDGGGRRCVVHRASGDGARQRLPAGTCSTATSASRCPTRRARCESGFRWRDGDCAQSRRRGCRSTRPPSRPPCTRRRA